MIHAASRDSLASLREHLDNVERARFGSDELTRLAAELYQVSDLLAAQPQLRRRVSDPTTGAEGRAGLIGGLLDGRIGEGSVQLVREAVSLRWSSPWDLVDALELIADAVLFLTADQEGSLDEVEDELFRFGRVLDSDSRLTTLLDDYSADAQRRAQLLRTLVEGKVAPVTQQLLEHAVASQRKRSITFAVDDLLNQAAARRNRSMARVLSPIELTDEQEARLTAVLSAMYGRPITVLSAIEPSLIGGLVIRIGDEVIDGSVAARLIETKSALGT